MWYFRKWVLCQPKLYVRAIRLFFNLCKLEILLSYQYKQGLLYKTHNLNNRKANTQKAKKRDLKMKDFKTPETRQHKPHGGIKMKWKLHISNSPIKRLRL